MTPNALNMHIVHKTLLKSLHKHYQTVFSRFLATTTFVPAENTRHSEFPRYILLISKKTLLMVRSYRVSTKVILDCLNMLEMIAYQTSWLLDEITFWWLRSPKFPVVLVSGIPWLGKQDVVFISPSHWSRRTNVCYTGCPRKRHELNC
jgi:hypothetical protein